MSSPSDKRLFHLLFMTLVAAIGGFLFGFDTGVVSGLIEPIQVRYGLTPFGEGWFTSSVLVGCILGASMAGIVADAFGRKIVLLVSGVLFFVSALGCGYPPGFTGLVIFRLIGGIGVGIASMVAPLYISEISPPRYRGRLVSIFQLAIVFGVAASYASNALIHSVPPQFPGLFTAEPLAFVFVEQNWRGMFLMGCFPALAFFFLTFFIPESPRWWAAQGRKDKAMTTLATLLGEEEADLEMQDIENVLQQETGTFAELFGSRLRFGLVVAVLLMFFSQVTGINVIIYYGNEVGKEAGFSKGFSFAFQTIIGFVNIVFTFLALWKIDQWGRKTLLKIGTAIILCALTSVASLFFLKAHGYVTTAFLVLFPILVVTFVGTFAMSWGPVPWVVVSEIFPARIRGRAASIGTTVIWISCFLVIQTFPMIKSFGPEFCFAIYAAFMIPAMLFVWFYMPETKGRSLEELERELYG